MKKFLLTVACAVAVSASAQIEKSQLNSAVLNQSKAVETTMSEAYFANEIGAASMKAPMKSAEDGVYYKVPVGSMWRLSQRPAYSWSSPYLVLSPWTDLKFTNMGTTKQGDWTIVMASSVIDLNEDTDEENNLIYSYTGGVGGYYGMTYTEGEVSYIPNGGDPGTEVINVIDDASVYHSFVPSITVTNTWSYRGVLKVAGASTLFGAGTYTSKDVTYTSVGFLYTTPKPLSPLYVEEVTAWGYLPDTDLDPLSGKELRVVIVNTEDPDAEQEVLTCTAKECVFDRDASNAETGKTQAFYQLYFTKKVVDEISGEEIVEPIVIDYVADMYFLGFDQEGVNISVAGVNVPEEYLGDDTDANRGWVMLKSADSDEIKYLTYQGNVQPWVGFKSIYDHCEVMTSAMSSSGELRENVNGIKVSNDGQECGNVVFSNIEGVEVYTALDWEDEESGEEMYWSDDMYDYDWIQNLTCSEVLYSNSENAIGGCYYIGAVCDELPDGVEGRYAVIHLNGRGVTSEPIFILQGNITMEEAMTADAIKNVNANSPVANGKTYNMMGQEVSKNAKGLVIRNGQKMLVK